jgi:peptidoglycan/LPS O-acetylase OafA/YrhL
MSQTLQRLGADAATSAARDDIPALTGLRGVAALLVLLFHFYWSLTPPVWGFQRLMNNGYLAVDIFFVLSGFLMVRSYAGLFSDGAGVRPTTVFLVRRIARVYPVYLLATAVFIALTALGYADKAPVDPLHVTLNLTMMQSWFSRVSYDPPGWSISTEFLAYLLFPLLLVRLRAARPLALAAAAAICGVALYVVFEALSFVEPWRFVNDAFAVPGQLVRCLAGFTLGMLAAFSLQFALVSRMLSYRLVAEGVPLLFLALLAGSGNQAVTVLVAPLLVLTLTVKRSGAVRVMSSRVCVFMGQISYTVYLFHWLIRSSEPTVLRKLPFLSHSAYLSLSFAGLVVGCWLLYRWFEVPARRWIRAFEPGRLGRKKGLNLA